jgi:hypothetical protein
MNTSSNKGYGNSLQGISLYQSLSIGDETGEGNDQVMCQTSKHKTEAIQNQTVPAELDQNTAFHIATLPTVDRQNTTPKPCYKITADVWQEIKKTIGKLPPESGGMLGGCRDTNTISTYYFDNSAQTTGSAYSPDVQVVNTILDKWNNDGIQLMGMIHSHPDTYRQPSSSDEEYAKRIISACKGMTQFFMPIVITRPYFELLPFHVHQEDNGDFTIDSCHIHHCLSTRSAHE